jgi:hypothetical protein
VSERGCVEDQPQHVRQANPLRLVEDDTAAIRREMRAIVRASQSECSRGFLMAVPYFGNRRCKFSASLGT